MSHASGPKISVQPQSGRFESLTQAVLDGGGELSELADAQGLIWADSTAQAEMPGVLSQCPNLQWVSLPFAGIEPFVPHLDTNRIWTCAKGVYATPVAEHALTLALAGLRGLGTYARAASWEGPQGRNLIGANVTIFGAGGITSELIRLLEPFGCRITVVRRQPDPVPGAERTLAFSDRSLALADADVVVLALALTDETRGVIGEAELASMPQHCWLVNVARGGHVDHDALLSAVRAEAIGGAALDVTSPEPLPVGHGLWSEPRVIITPHIANTPEMGIPLLAAHVRRNVANFAAGQQLEGLVDVQAGY